MTTNAAPVKQTDYLYNTTTTAQARPANAEAIFKQAKQELPEDYYALYRIVERIARANKLDYSPWRVYISPEYDVNAFAADVNLVAFYSGLLDRLHGDVDAIACVVGHEMAHHIKNHIAVGSAERERILQQLRAEAIEEVAAEEEDLRNDLEEIGVNDWVAGNAGILLEGFLGGRQGGLIGNLVGSIFGGGKERRVKEAVARIDEIYAQKEAQRLQEWRELNHHQEFESDELGYTYMVRAGFKPQGCQTVMTVLSRLGVTASDTHPATPDRIAAINGFATKYSYDVLVNEGKSNLAASSVPLSYGLSRDKVTLRINSRQGSGDIDSTLPQ
ncbi:MAG: M48 family metalloprotease [Symploca sp. SIO2E6]|nr:M48 family metalloprotease [Symploca sp. SIO2E6]